MRRMIIVRGASVAIALAAVFSFLFANEEARGQTTVNVEVGSNYFCSSSNIGVCETNVTAGDTVTWQWVSGTHTVTQCDATFSTCPPAVGFNSGNLGSGATFSQAFNSPGSFEYHCNLHPSMQGRINVAAAQATPTASAGQTAPAQTGPTASAGPAATRTAAPAVIPGTGGAQTDGGSSWSLILAISGGVLLIASAGASIAVRRRS